MYCLFSLQGYIVLNRPWAFVQWLEMTTIEEEYDLFHGMIHFTLPAPDTHSVAPLLMQICIDGRA